MCVFMLTSSLPQHCPVQFTLWQRTGDKANKKGYGQEGMSILYEVRALACLGNRQCPGIAAGDAARGGILLWPCCCMHSYRFRHAQDVNTGLTDCMLP